MNISFISTISLRGAERVPLYTSYMGMCHCGGYSFQVVKVKWCPLYGPKSLFKFGEKRPIVCYCTQEQKMNFEGFT